MKRDKIKISVVDRKGAFPCHRGHKTGDTFDFDLERGKICPMALHAMFPYIDILRYGGKIPSAANPDGELETLVSCPDAETINIFKVERAVEEDYSEVDFSALICSLTERMIEYYSNDPKRIQHFIKVHSFARLIGKLEKIDNEDLKILELAAVVHDIGIKAAEEKYYACDGKKQELEGSPIAEKLLCELGCPKEICDRVCYLVGHHHTYDNIDGIDYQILVEADFLVNIYEDGLSKDAAKTAYERIFRTASGKNICRQMFGI